MPTAAPSPTAAKVENTSRVNGQVVSTTPNVPEPIWDGESLDGEYDIINTPGDYDSQFTDDGSDDGHTGTNICDTGLVSSPRSHEDPDPTDVPAAAASATAEGRALTARCHAFEREFNRLVDTGAAYDVSEREIRNASFRGVSVMRVPKFSAVLSVNHATPITVADLQLKPPKMVGHCRMYRWYGSHRFLYVQVSA